MQPSPPRPMLGPVFGVRSRSGPTVESRCWLACRAYWVWFVRLSGASGPTGESRCWSMGPHMLSLVHSSCWFARLAGGRLAKVGAGRQAAYAEPDPFVLLWNRNPLSEVSEKKKEEKRDEKEKVPSPPFIVVLKEKIFFSHLSFFLDSPLNPPHPFPWHEIEILTQSRAIPFKTDGQSRFLTWLSKRTWRTLVALRLHYVPRVSKFEKQLVWKNSVGKHMKESHSPFVDLVPKIMSNGESKILHSGWEKSLHASYGEAWCCMNVLQAAFGMRSLTGLDLICSLGKIDDDDRW